MKITVTSVLVDDQARALAAHTCAGAQSAKRSEMQLGQGRDTLGTGGRSVLPRESSMLDNADYVNC